MRCEISVVSDEDRGGFIVECQRHGRITTGIADAGYAARRGDGHVYQWDRIDSERAVKARELSAWAARFEVKT